MPCHERYHRSQCSSLLRGHACHNLYTSGCFPKLSRCQAGMQRGCTLNLLPQLFGTPCGRSQTAVFLQGNAVSMACASLVRSPLPMQHPPLLWSQLQLHLRPPPLNLGMIIGHVHQGNSPTQGQSVNWVLLHQTARTVI